MVDVIISILLVLVLGAAIAYIVKAKKSGAKCIGCPVEGGCSHKHNETSGCGCGCESEKCGDGCHH